MARDGELARSHDPTAHADRLQVGKRDVLADVELDGVRQKALHPVRARRAGIALVPGNRGTGSAVRAFDVRENITLANLEAVSVRGRIVRSRELAVTRHWIDEFSLRPPDPGRSFSQLSGGNQQKAILARWFNIDPRVVLLDDPTGGVDVGAREAIYDLVRAAAANGTAFVICSSDHEDLVELCSRVIVLRRGAVVEELVRPDISADRLLRATMGDHDA